MRHRRLNPLALAAAWLTLAWCAQAARGASPGTYLIVHPPHLADAARQWAEYRAAGGWHVIDYQLARRDDPAESRRDVQRHIRRVAATPAGGNLAVLLLGDADGRGVPTWNFPQTDASLRALPDAGYATDHPYQLLADGGLRPEVLLGRVPARTAVQAEIVLEKIKRYEQDDRLGPWRRRISYAAAEGHFGVADSLLETMFRLMISRLVPDAFDVTMTYAKATSIYCPPPSRLTDAVLHQIGDGALLFNYVGHGSADGLDRLHFNGRQVPILEVADLQRLQGGHPRLAVALLTCCSAGWYDMPGDRMSLAEAMLFHPAGPVAVIAASRPTHPYANVILQKDVTRLLLVDQVRTVGQLDLLAMQSMLDIDDEDRGLDALAAPMARLGQWPSTLQELRRMHVQLYNLLGDPALQLAVPRLAVDRLAVAGGRLTGRVEGMVTGAVTVTVETDRTAPARSGDLVMVFGGADPDLDAKAAHNYDIANDVVLARVDGDVSNGQFEVPLPGGPPSPTWVIKAYALGRDATGKRVDAIGALRFKSR